MLRLLEEETKEPPLGSSVVTETGVLAGSDAAPLPSKRSLSMSHVSVDDMRFVTHSDAAK
jgi:hypothetical protein